ncbi:MAG: TonB-dependent receptor plug domain-containing protein [Ignavibacteriaceae bacterium]
MVRGLAPKFNSITLNGERIPATDPENRSVDLSMISSDMLEGIEVYKTLTPDHDGDAIGGTINFVVKKAQKGLKADVRLNETYNAHEKDPGLYKGSFSISNRFLKNKLGVIATANLQRANRSSDLLDAGYSFAREDNQGNAIINVNSLNLGDRTEIRKRYGGSVSLDYKLDGNNTFTLSSFYGRTDRDEVRMRKRYKVEQSYVEYWLRNRHLLVLLLKIKVLNIFQKGQRII